MEEAASQVSPVEKKGKGRMVGILVALVLVLGAGAAGAVFAPRLLAKGNPAEKAAPAEKTESAEAAEPEAAEEADDAHDDLQEETEKPAGSAAPMVKPRIQRAGEAGDVTELQPIVVDSHAEDGNIRHVKVVLAVEHPKEFKADEFKRYVPFAREAAISYLRTRTFEQLSDPKGFDRLRRELASEVIDAVNKKHAKRVLVTDYVVQ